MEMIVEVLFIIFVEAVLLPRFWSIDPMVYEGRKAMELKKFRGITVKSVPV